jgi:hypothetical protein
VSIPDTRHFMNRSPQNMTHGSCGIDMRLPWGQASFVMANALIVRPRPLPGHTTRFSLWRISLRKRKNPFVKRFKRLVPDRAAGGMFVLFPSSLRHGMSHASCIPRREPVNEEPKRRYFLCFSSCPFAFFSERSERVVGKSAPPAGGGAGKRLKIPR